MMNKKIGATKDVAADVRRRLHMVQGQLDGVIRMIDEDKECIETLTQFKAARAGLERAITLFLEENMKRCVGVEKLPKDTRIELEHIITELVK